MAGKSTYVLTVDNKQLLKGLHEAENAYKKLRQAATGGSSAGGGNNLASGISNSNMQFQQATQSATSFWKIAGGAAAGTAALGVITSMVGIFARMAPTLANVTAKYQKYAAVLTNSLGSQVLARKAMEDIVNFAAKTPFQVDELTDSFIKYTNRGLKPTQEEMTKLGDLAATTGKEFGQLTEAVLDATTGEFERLKEFGIKASQAGDKVTLSFKNQTVQVDKNSESIRQAIIAFGGLQGVAGSMDAISKTLGGTLSNLEDNTDQLLRTIGEVFSPVFAAAATTVADLTKQLKDLINSEEDQIKTSVDAALQSQKEAKSGQELLNRYEQLAKKGVKATKEEKEELIGITYQMRDAFGESVVSIDKETGALTLNTEAVKTAIKQKLLLSNQEASSLALKLQNSKDQIKAEQAEIAARQTNIKKQQDLLKQQGVDQQPTIDGRGRIIKDSGSASRDALTDQKLFLKQANDRLLAAQKSKADYLAGLKQLGFNEDSASLDKLVSDAEKAANAVNKITGTSFGTGAGSGKIEETPAEKAAKDLTKAYESLAIQADQAFTNSLEGVQRLEAMANLSLIEIEKLETQLREFANQSGQTLTQEALNNLETLRNGIISERDQGIIELQRQAAEALQLSFDAQGKAISKAYALIGAEKEKNLNDLISDLDHLKEVSLKQNELLVQSEENKNKNILEIDLKYAQLRLNAIQNDPARKKEREILEYEIALYRQKLGLAGKAKSSSGTDDNPAYQSALALEGVTSIFGAVADAAEESADREIAAQQKVVDALREQVAEKEQILADEQDKAAKGYRNNVVEKQKELNELKAREAAALEQQKRIKKEALQAQLRADAITQTSNIITMATKSVAANAELPFGLGIVAAAAAIAGFIALIAGIKAKQSEINSLADGGPVSQFLNGPTDKHGQRGYHVTDSEGVPFLKIGGDETIVNGTASVKYRAELAEMNAGRYPLSRTFAKQAEKHTRRQESGSVAMKEAFKEAMLEYMNEDHKFWKNDKKIIGTPDDYLEITPKMKRRIRKN